MTFKRVSVFLICSLAAIGCGLIAVADDSAEAQKQQQRIRQALDGTDAPAPTGDGILDDVLDVIQQQGSILKGSSLDQESIDQKPAESAATRSHRAAVAEQLLKASRLLERLESADRERLTLIAKMRDEAKDLLND